MEHLLRLTVLISLLPPLAANASLTNTQVVSAAKKNVSTVAWDKGSIVRGDFNGDGLQDAAIVGTRKQRVFLAIVFSTTSKKPKVQMFEFGISSSAEDSICDLPMKLDVNPLDCSPLDDPLPGCKQSNNTNSLELYGGECDPMNFYWDHEKNLMRWWRE